MSVSYPEASTKTSTARKIGREFALPSSGVKLPVDIQPAEVIDSSQDEVGKPPASRTPSASEALFSIGVGTRVNAFSIESITVTEHSPDTSSSEVRKWPFGDLECGQSATRKSNFLPTQTCRPKTLCQRPLWRK